MKTVCGKPCHRDECTDDSNSCYHCSSKDDPAEILTRGASVNSILKNPMWLKGPKCLEADDLLIINQTISAPETDYIAETNAKYKNDINDF